MYGDAAQKLDQLCSLSLTTGSDDDWTGITEPFAAVIDGAFAADGAGPVTEVAIGAEVVDDAVVFVEAGFVAPLSMMLAKVRAGSTPTPAAADASRAVLGVATTDVAIGGEVASGTRSLLKEHEPANPPTITTTRSVRSEFMRAYHSQT